MGYFRGDELPSCSTCAFATKYIPSYSFPYINPKCAKGHGECDIDKLCEDYIPTIATCGNCEHNRINVKSKTGFQCIYHNIPISFDGKFCNNYQYRYNRLKEIR